MESNRYYKQIRLLTAIGLALIAVVFFVLALTPMAGQHRFENKARSASSFITGKAQSLRVELNTASVEQLEKLPQIGATRAKSIVAYREKNGAFKTPEDLLLVEGIGQKTFEEIKQYIYVQEQK